MARRSRAAQRLLDQQPAGQHRTRAARAEEIKSLKREVAELRRANEILRATSLFFATELDALNFEYAEQMARDWNSKDTRHEFLGFVTEFDLRADFAGRYAPHQVGARQHQELWVPAEELEELNAAILGAIRVVAEYRYGERVP